MTLSQMYKFAFPRTAKSLLSISPLKIKKTVPISSPNIRTCKSRVYHYRPVVKQVPRVLDEYESPKRVPKFNYDEIELPEDFCEVYQDFLPNPTPWWRNSICEKLERQDMLARRSVMPIPEFYAGSIMAVTIADNNASEKLNRFLGICIDRGGHGTTAWFILRNFVDYQGLEINYALYSPQIVEIEVIKLEKRLDDKLYYLRDCLPEYSTFPQDMDPIHLPINDPVPINPTMAELKPRPWHERWERQDLKGLTKINLPAVFWHRAKLQEKPWEKYDLMLEYRQSISENDLKKVYNDLKHNFSELELNRRKTKKLTRTL